MRCCSLPTSCRALGDLIYNYIQTFSENAGTLSFFGFVFLIFMAFSLLTMLEKVFLRIWQIPKSRPFFARFFIFWVALTLVPHSHCGVSLFQFEGGAGSLSGLGLPKRCPHPPPLHHLGGLLCPLPFSAERGDSLDECPLRRPGGGDALGRGQIRFRQLCESLFHPDPALRLFGIIPIFLLWLYFTWILVLYGAEVAYLFRPPGRCGRLTGSRGVCVAGGPGRFRFFLTGLRPPPAKEPSPCFLTAALTSSTESASRQV